jgi:hypothetical protein
MTGDEVILADGFTTVVIGGGEVIVTGGLPLMSYAC